MLESLRKAAERFPDRIAAEGLNGARLSYGQLHALSSKLAHQLLEWRIGQGERVGMLLPRSPEALAALHGILSSGAACVPLDAEMPPARCASILEECKVSALIGEAARLEGLLPLLKHQPRVLAVQAGLGSTLDAVEVGRSSHRPGPEELAFILYTSGSTGRPKGVMLSHGNVSAALDWYAKACEPTPEDRFASHAPFQFSVTLFNACVAAKAGATVLFLDDQVRRSPRELAQALSRERISIWMAAPSVLRLLLRHGGLAPGGHPDLRQLFCGGEVLSAQQALELGQLFGAARLRGLYASTEASGCTLYSPQLHPAPPTQGAAIGEGALGVELKVVGEDGLELREGSGELWVCGPAVALGYWGEPALNERAFWTDESGKRWFRSGDRARRDAAGGLHFLGRLDRMVKRRGYRVALEEVEACLATHPGIAEAVAIASADPVSGTRIEVLFVPRPGEPLSQVELRLHCAGRLPSYFLPDLFVEVRELPKTANGKLDLQALGLERQAQAR